MKISMKFGKESISDIIKKYKYIGENIDNLKKIIIDDLKEIGLKEINSSIGTSEYKTSEPLTVINRENTIGIGGTQAIYDEYGTGTVGELNPHPEKPGFLDDYNYNTIANGGSIRENKKEESTATLEGIPIGGLYWTFKFNGKKIYTQGRPAGMHVYKAKRKIRDNLKDIVKKKVGEYLSKR